MSVIENCDCNSGEVLYKMFHPGKHSFESVVFHYIIVFDSF